MKILNWKEAEYILLRHSIYFISLGFFLWQNWCVFHNKVIRRHEQTSKIFLKRQANLMWWNYLRHFTKRKKTHFKKRRILIELPVCRFVKLPEFSVKTFRQTKLFLVMEGLFFPANSRKVSHLLKALEAGSRSCYGCDRSLKDSKAEERAQRIWVMERQNGRAHLEEGWEKQHHKVPQEHGEKGFSVFPCLDDKAGSLCLILALCQGKFPAAIKNHWSTAGHQDHGDTTPGFHVWECCWCPPLPLSIYMIPLPGGMTQELNHAPRTNHSPHSLLGLWVLASPMPGHRDTQLSL